MCNETDTIVVGNSPALLRYKFGKFIDSFTNVIRFNKAMLAGYKEQVGEKFDTWITSELWEEVSGYTNMYWAGINRLRDRALKFAEERDIPITIIPHGHRFKRAQQILGPGRYMLTTGIAFLLYITQYTNIEPVVIGFDGYAKSNSTTSYYDKIMNRAKFYTHCGTHQKLLSYLHRTRKIVWRKL